MFGCYLARELFPDATLYYSKDSHYSVAKIIKLLRIKSRAVDSCPAAKSTTTTWWPKSSKIRNATPSSSSTSAPP